MLLVLSKGILQFASLKTAIKKDEIFFVPLGPYIQNMLKTYASQIPKK